jgi:hypothetical protein
MTVAARQAGIVGVVTRLYYRFGGYLRRTIPRLVQRALACHHQRGKTGGSVNQSVPAAASGYCLAISFWPMKTAS